VPKIEIGEKAFKMILRLSVCCILAFIFTCHVEAAKQPSIQSMVDKVIVIKNKRVMMLLKDNRIVRSYRVALGKQPVGTKVRAGDHKTPEGSYTLVSRNAKSKFHLSMKISYPNEADVQNAKNLGTSPGGGIMIHGLPQGLGDIGKLHRHWDWTEGCIAVTNSEIEEIWKLIPDGTPIEIKP
jgi:murein L,D-transpeptidase YafK